MRKLVLFSDCVCVSLLRASRNLQELLQQRRAWRQIFNRLSRPLNGFQDAFLEELNKFNPAKFQTVQTLEGIVDSRAAKEKKLFSTSSAGGSAAAADCWAGHKVVGFCALEHQPEEDDDDQNVVYFEKDYCGDLRPENGVCADLFGSYADSNEGKMVACLERFRSKSPSGDVCSEEMFYFLGALMI